MRRLRVRAGVAMLELIFAIVVMGIVLMSAPQLISTATQSTIVTLQQEGVNEALSRVNMILTYPWDERDTNDSCIPPVLLVNTGDDELKDTTGKGFRAGVPDVAGHQSHSFFSCGSTYFTPTMDTDGKDDIDDFAGTTTLQLVSSGSGGKDYVEKTTVSIATGVSYISDSADYSASGISFVPSTTAATNPSNIKAITVTLTSTSPSEELQKNIVMRAFSCNVGGFEYFTRSL